MDRRELMKSLAAGLMTIVVWVLYATGSLEIWHLYVTGAISGAFQAFQFPAYSAAVTTMPTTPMAANQGMISKAPRKTKNSAQKPARPGKPKLAKAVTKKMP